MAKISWAAPAGSGVWVNGANWTGGLQPSAGDDVVIDLFVRPYIIDFSTTSATISNLTIDSVDATLRWDAVAPASLTVAGATVLNAGNIDLTDPVPGSTLTTSSLMVSAGAFLSSNTVTVTGAADFTGGMSLNAIISGGGILNAGTLAVSGQDTLLGLQGGALNSGAGGVDIGVGSEIRMSSDNVAAVLDATEGGLHVSGVLNGAGNLEGDLSGVGTLEASGGILNVMSNVRVTGIAFDIDTSVADSTMEFGGEVVSGLEVTYLNTNAVFGGSLLLGTATSRVSFENNGTIVGIHVGTNATVPTDVIDLADVSPATISQASIGNMNTIDLFDSAGVVVDHFTLASPPDTGTFVDWRTDGKGGTVIYLSDTPCFVAGTHILTATGERRVEDLLPGDIALTVSDGALRAQPIAWIGRRQLDLNAHLRLETIAPVRIRRGAFSDHTPHHDLLISPDHAIFVDDKLICARQLVNGTTIRQEKGWASVEYFHVQLNFACRSCSPRACPRKAISTPATRAFSPTPTRP